LSRNDTIESLYKKRPHALFPIVCAVVLVCAGVIGTRTPASADAFSHLPTIDLYPTVSWATGNDEYGSPGGPDPCNNYTLPTTVCPNGSVGPNAGDSSAGVRSGVLDLNAVVTIPLIKSLTFQYEHDRAAGIDTTIGRVIQNGKIVYPGSNNDIVDTFRLVYGFKGVAITAGTFYRFRHDNPATNDVVTNGGTPSDWHEQFLQLNYTAPPIVALNGLTLGAYIDGEYNKHHASANWIADLQTRCNTGGGCYSDTDGKARYGANWGFNANLPVNHSFAIFGSWSKGAFDWFDNNSPYPFYYIIDDVGITKKFNKVLSLSADTNNLTQYNLAGFPFVPPNTIHRVYFDVALDIHLAP
jgi:hypothetical protein